MIPGFMGVNGADIISMFSMVVLQTICDLEKTSLLLEKTSLLPPKTRLLSVEKGLITMLG